MKALLPEFDAVLFGKQIKDVSDSIQRLLNGPVKEEAIFLLIAQKLSDRRQGTRVVEDVFRAAVKLKEYLR